MPTGIKLETTRFNVALDKYHDLTSKDAVETFNIKAYWVARNAAWMTKKASKKSIRKYYSVKNLPAVIAAVKWKKLTRANTKAELQDALKELKAAKVKAVASLCAGWIPTIKKTAGWAKQSKTLRGVRQKGMKGRCSLAQRSQGMNAKCVMENFGPKKMKDSEGAAKALGQWGLRGLNAAFKKEAISMEKYLMEKMKKSARKVRLR